MNNLEINLRKNLRQEKKVKKMESVIPNYFYGTKLITLTILNFCKILAF